MKFQGNFKDFIFVILGMVIIELILSAPLFFLFKNIYMGSPAQFHMISFLISLAVCFSGGILYTKRYLKISNPDIFLILILQVLKLSRGSSLNFLSIIFIFVLFLILYSFFILGITVSLKFLNK